jgi:hypothetical protein
MIAATVAGLAVLPLIVLRGRTLASFYATALGIVLFAWILSRRIIGFEPYFAFVAVAVVLLCAFCGFVAMGRDVKWSANRAAGIAAIVYALAIHSMTRLPIDGDEPYYLLVTESIVRDFDFDLTNQYRELATSETGRVDLVPQQGDTARYSHHEPLLSLLMVPGYAIAGLYGAVATIALFGVLLVRSTIRWMEDEGVPDDAARAVFPFFAFGPPVLFYATRIWPEVPAAFLYVEALRGLRSERAKRWAPALAGLILLKLRFALIGVTWPFLMRRKRTFVLAAMVAIAVIGVLVTGRWRELVPSLDHHIGLAGLVVDGMSGIVFQAPFYLFGLFALTRWRSMPPGFRAGILGSLLYLFYLLPRPQSFSSWGPPLRYVVFLMPVLALGAAAVWDRLSRGAMALFAVWTAGLVIHGLARPHRLFLEPTGENAVGEWLSRLYQSDFSRIFPSFVRVNHAAWIGFALTVVLLFALRRYALDLTIPLVALAMATGFLFARQPGVRVEFEDAHVVHDGGGLYPPVYTVMRTSYRGGWVLKGGEAMTFLARDGNHTLHYITGPGALIEIAGRAYRLPSTERYATVRVVVPRSGRVALRCVSGAVNLDRMDHD